MHKRTAHRWRLATIMMVGAVFALGSFWLVQVINRGDLGGSPQALKTEPDYIIENFSFVHMTLTGQPHYIISGNKLTHRPSDDSLDVVQPVVQNLDPAQPPMTMHAKAAHIDQNSSVVDLMGNVDIQRPPLGKAKGMTLKTEALTVFTNEDRMQTKQPFQMVIGEMTLAGTGMKANNATGQVEVDNRMKMSFPPRVR
jgi:lipopolysaccharide export system protein LptC